MKACQAENKLAPFTRLSCPERKEMTRTALLVYLREPPTELCFQPLEPGTEGLEVISDEV